LARNNISDISLLDKVKFEKLELLNLNHNKISDISVLDKVKFEKLEKLDLGNNYGINKEKYNSFINNLNLKVIIDDDQDDLGFDDLF